MPKPPNTRAIQDPPFAVQVELVEGCNLRCSFCGLNSIRAKDNAFKFMGPDMVRHVAAQLARAQDNGWNPRIEFAMHGEPSMHPDLIPVLARFRRELPKHHLMMTSNGAGFLGRPKLMIAAMRYLNVLALDDYERVNIVERILQAVRNDVPGEAWRGAWRTYYYPAQREGNPHRRRKPSQHDLVVIEDIEQATSGTHSHVNNHAGCGAPPNNDAAGQRCAKPFRELSIRWDGNVAVCCNDWRGVYKCGNVAVDGVEAIWQGEAMEAARARLYAGRRDFAPCLGCDARSHRIGLLPDKYGKQTMPAPNDSHAETIARATQGPPYTAPVWREWETAPAESTEPRESP